MSVYAMYGNCSEGKKDTIWNLASRRWDSSWRFSLSISLAW
jgi:hypothetical protein